MEAEAELPEGSFPGAHAQLPRWLPTTPRNVSVETPILPLNAAQERLGEGWLLRLPVRAEHVTLSREVVSYERIVLRRVKVDDETHVEAVVQRELLRVETLGQARISGSEAFPARKQ